MEGQPEPTSFSLDRRERVTDNDKLCDLSPDRDLRYDATCCGGGHLVLELKSNYDKRVPSFVSLRTFYRSPTTPIRGGTPTTRSTCVIGTSFFVSE